MTEHVSFLRLERYRLDELSAGEAHALTAHLSGCEACRACLAEVERHVELPELPELPVRRALPRPQRSTRWLKLGGGMAGALALAAAALLMVRRVDPETGKHVPPARLGIKGGEVAIELVRKRGDALAYDATVFADGDAFKVLLTCPPPLTPHFDVVVYQAGRAYFPLSAGVIDSCGNRRTLAGAFSLEGGDDALVCVALDAQRMPSRARLGDGPAALPALSVCTRVTPSTAP